MKTTNIHFLSELVDIRAGYTFRESPNELKGSDVRMLQIKDIRDTDIIKPELLQEIEWTGKDLTPSLEVGEVVVAARGVSNKAAVMLSSTTVVASNQLLILKAKQDKLLPTYLCWFLNREATQKKIKETHMGSNMPSINKAGLGSIEVPLLTMEQQTNIVRIAALQQQEQAAYQALINNRINMLEGVFQQLIVGESK